MKKTKLKILIIEDDKLFLGLYSKLLKDADFDVVEASNAYQAIDLVGEGNIPDAILLDLFLPGVNGFALIHELQSYEDTRSIPIVVCSSSAESLDNNSLKSYQIAKVLDKSAMEPKDIVYAFRGLFSE